MTPDGVKLRAAIYLRQSMDRTGEGLAVDRQRTDCEKELRHRGWEIVGTYVDNDVSASSRKPRPAYEQMISDVRSGAIQAVVVWDLDRLTRRPIEVEDWITLHERHGVNLLTISEHIDLSTDNGRMYLRIKVAVARAEVERKSARQKRAVLQAAEQGRRVGGRRPFGYESDGMTICEPEAAAIRQAYDDALAGVPLAQVARDWNAAGLWTPQQARRADRKDRPSQWCASTVRDVLMNPRCAGFRGYGSVPEHGRRKAEIAAPAQWPGIVPEEKWRAVVGLLSDPARFTAKNRGARALLTGVALCGKCGATVNAGGANTHQRRVYRCSATPGHLSRSALPVEELVSEVAIARLSRPDAVELLRDDKRPDIDALRTDATALRIRLEQLGEEFADGAIDRGALRSGTARLRAKLTAVEARMADTARVDVLGPLVRAGDAEAVRAVWEALSTDRQRVVINALMIIRLMPPGQGTRTFRPESVIITPRM